MFYMYDFYIYINICIYIYVYIYTYIYTISFLCKTNGLSKLNVYIYMCGFV